jgi:hypothetical protein
MEVCRGCISERAHSIDGGAATSDGLSLGGKAGSREIPLNQAIVECPIVGRARRTLTLYAWVRTNNRYYCCYQIIPRTGRGRETGPLQTDASPNFDPITRPNSETSLSL